MKWYHFPDGFHERNILIMGLVGAIAIAAYVLVLQDSGVFEQNIYSGSHIGKNLIIGGGTYYTIILIILASLSMFSIMSSVGSAFHLARLARDDRIIEGYALVTFGVSLGGIPVALSLLVLERGYTPFINVVAVGGVLVFFLLYSLFETESTSPQSKVEPNESEHDHGKGDPDLKKGKGQSTDLLVKKKIRWAPRNIIINRAIFVVPFLVLMEWFGTSTRTWLGAPFSTVWLGMITAILTYTIATKIMQSFVQRRASGDGVDTFLTRFGVTKQFSDRTYYIAYAYGILAGGVIASLAVIFFSFFISVLRAYPPFTWLIVALANVIAAFCVVYAFQIEYGPRVNPGPYKPQIQHVTELSDRSEATRDQQPSRADDQRSDIVHRDSKLTENLSKPAFDRNGANTQPDKRLKMIEVVLTLGGFLGIIIALQQDSLVGIAKMSFSGLVVMYIVLAFFAYSALSIPLPEKTISLFIRGLMAVFSAMLALALTIPATNSLASIFSVLEKTYIGSYGAVIVYLIAVLGLVYGIYFLLREGFERAFERMAPIQSNQNLDYTGG
jgi:hypothetical protein